jgi:hypothetical protein
MGKSGDGLGFALESSERQSVVRQMRGQHLPGDVSLET